MLSVEGRGVERCSTLISYLACSRDFEPGHVMLLAKFCMKASLEQEPPYGRLLSMSEVERFRFSLDLEKPPENRPPTIRPCLYSTVSSLCSSAVSSSFSELPFCVSSPSFPSAVAVVSTRGKRA